MKKIAGVDQQITQVTSRKTLNLAKINKLQEALNIAAYMHNLARAFHNGH